MSDLWELGAFELGTAIRDGVVSSREVVESHLARIEAVNPDVNAVTDTLADDALAAAQDADAAIARDEPASPFHGVPFTVKETIDLAGVQIIGPRYREDVCLTAAWEVERALGTITPIDPR
jgi:amidase